MFAAIRAYCDDLAAAFHSIPEERRQLLNGISDYIRRKKTAGEPASLVYICTHNSRRSQFGQVWAKVAGRYYGVPGIHTFSGGTEATAFHPNAINALIRAGFGVKPVSDADNAVYQVFYGRNDIPLECFSKVYDHKANPQRDFAAIMTCGEAEANCPYIPGAEERIATPYEDPKTADNSPLSDQTYAARCREIALECLYVFSKV